MSDIKLFQDEHNKYRLVVDGLDISGAVSRVNIEVGASGHAVAKVDLVGRLFVDISGCSFELTYEGNSETQADET